MSLQEYEISRHIKGDFYPLLMATMRRADDYGVMALRLIYPEVWAELQARYNAPGGLLPSDDLIEKGD